MSYRPNLDGSSFQTATMLETLLRKTRSLGSLLHANDPADAIRRRALRNVRQGLLALRRGQPFVYRTALRTRFLCIPSSATSVHHYLHRLDDLAELRIARNWLRAGDVCLDVGANIGCYTALFAETVGPRGRVVAVEPSPHTLRSLTDLVRRLAFDNVTIETACVKEQPGTVTFLVTKTGAAETTQALATAAGMRADYEPITVPATTIDHLLEHSDPPALVKIDIEGAEPLALAGASRLFQPDDLPLFIVELSRAGLRQFGFALEDVLRNFPAERFQRFVINREYPPVNRRFPFGQPVALADDAATDALPELANLIAVPRSGRFGTRRLDGVLSASS